MTQQAITKKDVFKYLALPGIRPRLFELFGRGFQHIPFFIALVFECVRLIPTHHPYLNAANIGRFGIRHVIAEAANNLVLNRKNIDQIIVFSLILLALVIVLVQMLTLFLALFIQPTMALPANFGEFFLLDQGYLATSAQQDIAMILLDMVFGVPGMFESCADLSALGPGVNCQDGQGVDILMPDDVATAAGLPAGNAFLNYAGAWPYPIHEGLHQMFAVYSYGLLIIAVFITIYFMFVVVAETAQSGTAFGKRFNKVWAPIRIVVAFGLLVPITFGMNSGQFIVLYAAKYGSSFATNGWAYFNQSITTHYTDGVQELASEPGFPEFGVLAQFFLTAATCKASYMLAENWTENDTDQNHIVPYLVRGGNAPNNALAFNDPGAPVPAYGAIANAAPNYNTLTSSGGFLNGASRAIIRFGKLDVQNYSSYLGNVKPFCGEIVMNFSDTRPGAAIPPNGAEPGIQVLQRFYFFLIKALWWTEGRMTTVVTTQPFHEHLARSKISDLAWNCGVPPAPCPEPLPTAAFRSDLLAEIERLFRDVLTGSGGSAYLQGGHGAAIPALVNSPSWDVNATLIAKGWGGAAIWYNRIAAMNGALTSAVFNIPLPSRYPSVMEYTKSKKIQYDQDTDPRFRFEPDLPDGNMVPYQRPLDSQYAQAMYEAYRYWDAADYGTSTQTQPTGNVMIDSINAILGTNGLFDMRKNTDVHPLAQLVGVGRGLVESSIRNLGYAAVGGTTGGIMRALANFNGGAQLAGVGASFLITTAMIGLTAGFILFYIVPFLPFIYFFFAVGGWIKGIFEAMVGVPLWALAHIRIDGPGLPGQAAINGYFLVFEIFLRPILILFGFLASILIFAALVEVLNDIFDLVVGNLGGFDQHEELNDTAGTGVSYIGFYRSAIDEFFFTLIYAIVVYMMGQSSFKLIDQIPNNILRWMNQNVATFNDSRQDPAQGLVSTAQIGAQQGLQSMGGGLQSIVKASTG